MISALSWIRKGVAQEIPDKYELSEQEYESIASKIGIQLSASKASLEKSKKKKTTQDLEALIPELQEYNLQDYDEDDDEEEESNSST